MTLFVIGHIALRALCIAFAVVLAALVARRVRRRHDPAIVALERRFVAGELSEDDFRRMRDTLLD
jgi:uncharacterized membrane protein